MFACLHACKAANLQLTARLIASLYVLLNKRSLNAAHKFMCNTHAHKARLGTAVDVQAN